MKRFASYIYLIYSTLVALIATVVGFLLMPILTGFAAGMVLGQQITDSIKQKSVDTNKEEKSNGK